MHNSKEILEISKALDNPTSIYMDPKQRTQIYVAFQQVAERFRRMECALDALKKTKQVTVQGREDRRVAVPCREFRVGFKRRGDKMLGANGQEFSELLKTIVLMGLLLAAISGLCAAICKHSKRYREDHDYFDR